MRDQPVDPVVAERRRILRVEARGIEAELQPQSVEQRNQPVDGEPEVHGRADKLWWQLGPELPELEPGKALWNRLQGFSITLRLGSDTLAAVAEIGIH